MKHTISCSCDFYIRLFGSDPDADDNNSLVSEFSENEDVATVLYVVRCAIWYHLHNLKNTKKTHGAVSILVKVKASAYNFIKINTPPWVFFTLFKLHKGYQIAQRTIYKKKQYFTNTLRTR